MPVNHFPYSGKLSGSDLTTLLVGENLGNKVNLDISRNVALAWDLATGPSTSSTGRSGDTCWQLTTTQYRIVWTARVTERVTKTTRPVPIVHTVEEFVSGAGKGIAALGGALLTWAGVTALTPAAPVAPGGAAAGGVVAGVGVAVTSVGELLKWLTDGTVKGWTTTYTEKGAEDFTHTVYARIDCAPNTDYPAVDVPSPQPSLELTKSETVARVGKSLSDTGTLHPPE
ncbi:MAG: hypothetical protein AAGI72_05635 [Pseudomonadota bacterium]